MKARATGRLAALRVSEANEVPHFQIHKQNQLLSLTKQIWLVEGAGLRNSINQGFATKANEGHAEVVPAINEKMPNINMPLAGRAR